MGVTIAVASQKGGVGKTTTALNLAYSLSRFGGPVLLVDGDPQGSLSIASNLRQRVGRGLVHVLREECALGDVVVATRDGTMSVVGLGIAHPADVELLEARARDGALAALLAKAAAPFVSTVIDAPAGIGGVVTSLLAASDGVILPVQARNLSLRTLPAFLRTMQHVRRQVNPRLRIEGVVVSMYNPASAAEVEALGEVRATFPEDVFFHTLIPASDLFEEASLRAMPVLLLPGGQEVGRAYLELALELRTKLLQRETDHGTAQGLF